MRNLIAKIDTAKETTQPSIRYPNSPAVNAKPNLISFNKLAPNITGIAKKNVNSAATSLDTPIINAPTIVAPDLEVPGINASIWKNPIHRSICILNCEIFVTDGFFPAFRFSTIINKIP